MFITVNSVGADSFPPTIEMSYTFDTAVKDKSCKNTVHQMSFISTQIIIDTINHFNIDFDISEEKLEKSMLEISAQSFSEEWDSEEDEYWNQYN